MASVAALAALLALSAPAAASATEPYFQFTGRGYGHGVGMSQWGAKGYAEHGWLFPAIMEHYFPSASCTTAVPAGYSSSVRVNLDPAASIVSGQTSYTRAQWTVRPGNVGARLVIGGKVTASTGAYRLVPGASPYVNVYDSASGLLHGTFASPVTIAETATPAGSPSLVRVVDGSSWGNVANRRYRGRLEVSANGTALKLINALGIESYTYGVMALESGYTWGEATKCQAVATRCFAMTTFRELRCTDADQVYGGFDVERVQSNQAVDDTRGYVVVAYDSSTHATIVVRTYFSSASGGHTENNENAPLIGGTPKPWYRGVPDEYEGETAATGHIWADDGNATFKEEACWSATVVRAKLAAAGLPVPAAIADIVVTQRGVSGRIVAAQVIGADGSVTTYTGSRIRSLRSALAWRDTWGYITRSHWDSTALELPAGGSVTARLRVTKGFTGTVKGLMRNGVKTGIDIPVVDGVGSVALTQPGVYTIDGTAFNATGKPDPAAGDLRGSGSLFRNTVDPLTVTAALAFEKTDRIQGADRYAVSANASARSFPTTASAVVIVNGAKYADALTAAGLAGSVPGGAPVLFSNGAGLSADVLAEIARLSPARAYIVGGPASVGEPVAAYLRTLPGLAATATVRIGGADRFEVAANVARTVRTLAGPVARVIVVNGTAYPDAIAASGFAYSKRIPILLVKATGVPAPTARVLAELKPASSLVVGGSGAVPSRVRAALPGPQAIASGIDRYDMAARLGAYLVASEGFTWARPSIASGDVFSDAIVGGPVVGRRSSPLLFTRGAALSPATAKALTAAKSSVTTATILGGPRTVTLGVQQAIEALLR